ncbi:hypothetical protein V8E55_002817 [Tylopilus felleus]
MQHEDTTLSYIVRHVEDTGNLKRESKQPAPNDAERLKSVSVQAWVMDETVTWKSYHPGKPRTKRCVEQGMCVASAGLDGSRHCNESHAVVEYAPFQKVPPEKKKIDARNNTIDKVAASHPPPPPTTTPLLEALKAEKSAQKDKDMILRNHVHYKDPAEDAKKKAAVVAADGGPLAQAAKPELPASTSKKAKMAVAAAPAQKASSQGRQGQGSGSGKRAAASGSAAAAPSGAKPPPPAPASASSGGHGARQRPPKELHGRSHSGKGVVSTAPAPASTSAGSGPGQAPPPAVTTESAPARSSSRPGDRKRHDKGGEPRAGPSAGTGCGLMESTGPGKAGKQKHREERSHPPEVVPSILERPVETASPDVVTMKRPQSPRGTEGSAVHGEGGAGDDANGGAGAGAGGGGRGSTRRGSWRGRGGHRGG